MTQTERTAPPAPAEFMDLSCREFVSLLGGKDPVPGGGGASALAGAIGAALGRMVGSLTVGKKKYADVEGEILDLMDRASAIEGELLRLVARDAEVFGPLAQAYKNLEDTETMEACLLEAALVPLEIMAECCKAIRLQQDFAAKGSRLAVSDAGVGAALCGAALRGASLNVFINTAAMKDKARAAAINGEADAMLSEYGALADRIFSEVKTALGG
jgi:formiminotetrahydrofolate cyclodeaminase